MNTLFLVNRSPVTMVQIAFIDKRILEVYLNGGLEMFVSM